MTDPTATPEEVRQSIVPKSDQLNADDLVAGPITVRIENVRGVADKQQPIIVDISGYPGRPYKPCKTCRRILVSAYSDEGKDWIGHSMTLYRDPDVMYGGVHVGGIRISHLSGLKETTKFIVTKSRSNRVEVTIHPLVVNDNAIDKYTQAIAAASTKDELKAVGVELKAQPKAVQDAVRSVYAARQKALSEPAKQPTALPSSLSQWKQGIDATTDDALAEFRREHLPTVQPEFRAEVEAMLGARERALGGAK